MLINLLDPKITCIYENCEFSYIPHTHQNISRLWHGKCEKHVKKADFKIATHWINLWESPTKIIGVVSYCPADGGHTTEWNERSDHK